MVDPRRALQAGDALIVVAVQIVTKGTRFDRDQYSAFDETGLATELKNKAFGAYGLAAWRRMC